MISGGLPPSAITTNAFPAGAAFCDVVGHSVPGGGGVTNGDWNVYVDKLMFLLGSPRRRRNLAIGGSVSAWPSNQNQTGDGGWGHAIQYLTPPGIGAGSGPYLPQADIAVCHAAQNDLASLGQANPTPMQEAHRFLISRMIATALAQSTDTAWTFTGTWAAASVVAGRTSPAGYRSSSTLNDTASLAVPSDYPGGRTVAINLLVNPAHDLTVGITIDGVARPDVRLQGSALCDPNGFGAATPQWNVKCLRYPIAAAGAHTIVATLKTQTIAGSTLYVDSAHIESDPADGPVVLVPNPYRCISYALWGASWANGASMSDTAVVAWQAPVSAVAAEFAHTLSVDIDSALNKSAALLAPDGVHPNDAGHGVVAKTAFDALYASGRVTSRQFSRVSPLLGPFWIPVGKGINSYPQFQSSWVNKGAPYSQVGYYKDALGIVHLRGAVAGGTSGGAAIFTLPAGYRPAAQRAFPVIVGAGTIGDLVVDGTGSVFAAAGGSTADTFLDGISFAAEA